MMWAEKHPHKFVKSESCYNQLEEQFRNIWWICGSTFSYSREATGGPSGLVDFPFVRWEEIELSCIWSARRETPPAGTAGSLKSQLPTGKIMFLSLIAFIVFCLFLKTLLSFSVVMGIFRFSLQITYWLAFPQWHFWSVISFITLFSFLITYFTSGPL